MTDLWTRLEQTEKPLVMYGMGNGADKIADILLRHGREIDDYFASDGFVRGQSFRGKRVMTFAELKEKYHGRPFVILVGFASSRPEVMAAIDALDAAYELYLPDVPVAGEALFDLAFFKRHREELAAVRSLWADETSRQVFDAVISYKLSGRLCDLKASICEEEAVYHALLRGASYRVGVDVGAYRGDSVEAFLSHFPNLSAIYSLEPDEKNYQHLCSFLKKKNISMVQSYPVAAWEEDTLLTFEATGNRNAALSAGGKKQVTARRLDTLLADAAVDYIKYDVEGSEYEALSGSRAIFARCQPDLLVSLYHKSEDLFRLPLFLKNLLPGYRFYLRRMSSYPAWDLNLYALSPRFDSV